MANMGRCWSQVECSKHWCMVRPGYDTYICNDHRAQSRYVTKEIIDTSMTVVCVWGGGGGRMWVLLGVLLAISQSQDFPSKVGKMPH